ncbi:MAG: hypothetical protein WC762_04510 [Methylobacter sp.]|jgi:hypothetical protein
MLSYSKKCIAKIKWALPLVFFCGYFLTLKYFDTKSVEYSAYNLLATVSCAVLLAQIKLFEQKFVAVWIALILFILVYFIRFYWVTIDALPVQIMLPRIPYNAMVADRNALLHAFKLSVMAFTSFSFSAVALLFFMRKQNSRVSQYSGNSTLSGLLAKRSLLVVTLLMMVLAYLTYKYHIGEMGASSSREALPFHLKGVIFYIRIVAIPLIILLSIYLAERSGHILTSRLGVLILMMHGIIDMLLRNSRSSLLLSLLLVLFLMLADGIKLRRKEKVFLGVMITVAFVMIPIMTEYRQIRVSSDLTYIEAFSNALNIGGKDLLAQIFKGLEFVLFRMPGIESLWCMIASKGEPLGIHVIDVINSKNGIAGYLTYIIYSMDEADNTLLAPGFVGWFYLVAGFPAIVLGSLFVGALSVLGWKFLGCRYVESGPVAQAFFLWMLFMALTEGTLDSMVYMFFVGLITIVVLEIGLRVFARRRAYGFNL